MTKVIITGINGFIGSHLCEHFLKNTDWDIIGFDKLSYSSGGYDRIRDIKAFDDKRVRIFTVNTAQPIEDGIVKEVGDDVDYILHLGADSHVDNSITDPVPFIQNNVNNTIFLLEYVRKHLPNLKKFLYFSTDEVYGTAPEGTNYKEGDRFNPGNPYSASKASAECVCYAYSNTYKIPIIITNTMNVIGERQHPEKYVPKVLKSILDGVTVPIHSNKEKTKAGQRYYIHARNVADAVLHILKFSNETLDNIDASKGKFNIVGEKEFDNLELAKLIENGVKEVMGYDDKYNLKYEMIDFHSQRPGHDLRYALNGDKMLALGWKPPVTIEESLFKTIIWTIENPKWL